MAPPTKRRPSWRSIGRSCRTSVLSIRRIGASAPSASGHRRFLRRPGHRGPRPVRLPVPSSTSISTCHHATSSGSWCAWSRTRGSGPRRGSRGSGALSGWVLIWSCWRPAGTADDPLGRTATEPVDEVLGRAVPPWPFPGSRRRPRSTQSPRKAAGPARRVVRGNQRIPRRTPRAPGRVLREWVLPAQFRGDRLSSALRVWPMRGPGLPGVLHRQ